MKIYYYLILFLLLANPIQMASASSAGDEGGVPPPPASGSGGGGGSPQFFDYYIPLIYDDTHSRGMAEVVVWVIQQSLLITSFSMDKSGSNTVQVNEPAKYVFNPRDNRGLTNGSLIRSTSPLLIAVQRNTEDIQSDESFGYSLLSDRMHGFEFTSHINGYLSVFSVNPGALIRIQSPGESIVMEESIDEAYSTIQVAVKKGSYINSSLPVFGAFISFEHGVHASMAVPRYLKGTNYIFDSILAAPRTDEIDRSYISIIPDEPTELTLIYKGGGNKFLTIFDDTVIKLDSELVGINSSRGYLDVTIHLLLSYGGLERHSMVQLIAAEEMEFAEFFVSPSGYSSHYATTNPMTSYYSLAYQAIPGNSGFIFDNRYMMNTTKYSTFSMISKSDSNIVYANNSFFSIITSPGLTGHPMSPSLSFLNLPLNSQSSRNITGLINTWYRFPNIAVGKIEVRPGPIEEFTGQVIHIEIYSNGTLPVSHFSLRITLDDEEYTEEFDFVQANESIIFEYTRFMDYGKTMINVTVELDIEEEVNEINEDDNSLRGDFNVEKNIRLRYSGILAVVLVIGLISIRIRRWLKSQREASRTHVDVLIEEVIE
ncbi:MAG: hypothetical protein INQ03_08660 [Candidatus Heimdallarchaeota archaeon]|nr:hypothetical protein [Candidatus Heimdallarchaeota archaeon]